MVLWKIQVISKYILGSLYSLLKMTVCVEASDGTVRQTTCNYMCYK